MESTVLKQLHLLNFKNYDSVDLELSSKLNAFVGNNGVGKTNILDAIHYLSVTKSYFNAKDSMNVKQGETMFFIQGKFEGDQTDEVVNIGFKPGAKKAVKRNLKEYDRLADHIGEFPLVMISPADRDLISEGSETRRKFVDGVISQSDKLYLDDLMAYNKALAQRNALLKYFHANRKFDADTLAIYDEQLVERGVKVFERRKSFMEELRPILLQYYKLISEGAERTDINYVSSLHEGNYRDQLVQSLQKDRLAQYSNVGIHKDDLEFSLGDFPLKKIGSQGQQKSFLIALKLAQFEFIKHVTGKKPILLLDDIFDKLDELRVEALIRLVNDHHFGQIFITDTHPSRTGSILKRINDESKVFIIGKKGIEGEAKQ